MNGLYLIVDKKQIKIVVAGSYFKRLGGLMFKKNINYGILFPKCRAIHTFLMREAIDVIGIDSNNKIIYKRDNVKPWRIVKVKNKQKKTSILELPKNTCLSFKIGDYLSFEDEDMT